MNNSSHTDIKSLFWLELLLPKKFRPFIYLSRIDRPIGIWLLLLPGWWSIVLASGGLINMSLRSWYLILLFGIGAVIMRSAGCIINDLWDKELDKLVERTKNRPLASGEISNKSAFLFLCLLLIFALSILLQMNLNTVILGVLTLPFIVIYPLMKRITWWPQAFLGITFNFGALLGWSAVTGHMSFTSFLIYIGGIFWTLGYDTIYAHQDIESDATVGIKSTALRFGNESKKWVGKFYELSTVFFFFAIIIYTGNLFAAIIVLLACSHLLWQITEWQPDNAKNSLEIFRSNRDFGVLFLVAISLTTL